MGFVRTIVRRQVVGQIRKAIQTRCEQIDWNLSDRVADPHGNPLAELDKSDPMRTHASDAVGYWIAREFPMRAPRGERGGPSII
jgi:hypothetical protein